MWQVIPQPRRLLAAHRDIETVQAGQGEAGVQVRVESEGGEVNRPHSSPYEKSVSVTVCTKCGKNITALKKKPDGARICPACGKEIK